MRVVDDDCIYRLKRSSEVASFLIDLDLKFGHVVAAQNTADPNLD
jgi:hypothetical protein